MINTALVLAIELGNLASVKEMAKLDGVDWEIKNEEGQHLEEIAR